MRHTVFPYLAVSSLLCVWVGLAATRPHYGETLVVEMGARVPSLDPLNSADDFGEARAVGKLRALVGDRLVRLDARGQPQPALAVSWEHDPSEVKWRFKLRPGVKWHDGSGLTAADVAAALQGAVPNRPWSVAQDTLELDAGSSWPELPVFLATAPAAVILRKPAAEGSSLRTVVGTGPFRVAEFDPAHRTVLAANEDYWGGRPYVDSIQIQTGRSSRERLVDLELGKADVVELDPVEARRAHEEGQKVWTSAPVELLVLKFNLSHPDVQDRRLREAIARSIGRAAIQKVLLQNYGEASGGILPQWLSGFAFLFSTAPDLERARQLRSEIGTAPRLKLGYDSSDLLARQVAERVAVNARDVGILLDVFPLPRGSGPASDPGAVVTVIGGLVDGPTLAEAALECSRWFGFPANGPSRATPEEVYAAERRFLDDFATVPLVDLPELVGLGPRVKNWSALRWGDWRLADVWLEAAKP